MGPAVRNGPGAAPRAIAGDAPPRKPGPAAVATGNEAPPRKPGPAPVAIGDDAPPRSHGRAMSGVPACAWIAGLGKACGAMTASWPGAAPGTPRTAGPT